MRIPSRFLWLSLSTCLLLVAASCSSGAQVRPNETIVSPSPTSGLPTAPLGKETPVSPSVSPTPMPTELPTESPSVSPTPLPIESPSVTVSIGNFQVITHCLEISQDLPPGANVSGTLVFKFGGTNFGCTNREYKNYLLNLEDGKKIPLDENNGVPGWSSVSPDRNYLAYRFSIYHEGMYEPASKSLVILRVNGEKLVQMPWEANWVRVYRWLDNERLLITLEGDQPRSLLLINPFTGERQIISPDFPDIYPYPFAEWDGSSAMSPDPTLARMVYAGINEIILWDIPGSQKITSLWNTPNWLVPRWTVDGERFVVGATMREDLTGPRFELYEVTRDGRITQLTQLEATFPRFTLEYYDWSPDARYVAFWLVRDDDAAPTERVLAVLDVEARLVTNTCISTKDTSPSIYPLLPIWSPDSRQVIVEIRNSDHILAVLVDIVENYAVVIEEGMIPVGWLKNK